MQINRWALLVCALLALPLLAGCNDGREYIAANEAILEELPLFPEAEEVGRESNSYSFSEAGLFDSIAGWGTRVTYRVPVGTTEEQVVEFYLDEVGEDWRRGMQESPVLEIAPGRPGVGTPGPLTQIGVTRRYFFCRDRAQFGLDTLNVAGINTYDIYVDQDAVAEGRGLGCTGLP